MGKFKEISRGEIPDQLGRHGYAPALCEHVTPPHPRRADRKKFYGKRNKDGHLAEVICAECVTKRA